MADDVKVWKKTMRPKNRNTGNVCYSLEEAMKLRPGQVLAVYEPRKCKEEKHCRGKMIITQSYIDSLDLRQDTKSGEHFYLMSYNLVAPKEAKQ